MEILNVLKKLEIYLDESMIHPIKELEKYMNEILEILNNKIFPNSECVDFLIKIAELPFWFIRDLLHTFYNYGYNFTVDEIFKVFKNHQIVLDKIYINENDLEELKKKLDDLICNCPHYDIHHYLLPPSKLYSEITYPKYPYGIKPSCKISAKIFSVWFGSCHLAYEYDALNEFLKTVDVNMEFLIEFCKQPYNVNSSKIINRIIKDYNVIPNEACKNALLEAKSLTNGKKQMINAWIKKGYVN